jgi:hypothetical protein
MRLRGLDFDSCSRANPSATVSPSRGGYLFITILNAKGRSHQPSQAASFYGDRIRAHTAHPRRTAGIMNILEAVAAGRFREIAIAREVGDSVLYHSLSELAIHNGVWGGWADGPVLVREAAALVDTCRLLVAYLDRDMEFVWTPKHLDKMSWHRSSSVPIKPLRQTNYFFSANPATIRIDSLDFQSGRRSKREIVSESLSSGRRLLWATS